MRNLASRAPLRRALVLVVGLLAGATFLLASLGNSRTGRLVDDLLGFGVSLLAGAICVYAWRTKTTHNRGPWLWIGSGCFCWSARALVQGYYQVALGQHLPHISAADFFDLAQAVLFTIGVLNFRNVRWNGLLRAGALLDAAIVTAGMFFLVAVIASRFLDLRPASPLSAVLFFGGPVDDVFLASLCLMLWVQALPQRKSALGLLMVAFVTMLLSDSALVLRHGQGVYFGRIWDLGWIAEFMLISLAALYVRPVELAAFQSSKPQPMASLALPYILVSLDLVWAVIMAIIFGPMDRALVFLAGIIMVTMIIRQVVTISQYRALLNTFARESEVLDNYFASHRVVQTGTGTVELVD